MSMAMVVTFLFPMLIYYLVLGKLMFLVLVVTLFMIGLPLDLIMGTFRR